MINWGTVPAGSVLPFMFGSYDGATGASEAISGLLTSDIEVFKGTSMTQRTSDNGYTLLDTDGIDIDGMTGINGISIDTGDNSDSGFYAAGSFYTVVIASITADTQTVNFVLGTFRLCEAETTAGRVETRVASVANSAITAAAIATDAIDADALASDAGTELGTAVWATAARTLTALDEDSTTLDLDATIRGAVGLAVANLDTQLDAIPTAAEVWAAGTRTLTAIDEDSTTLDLDATVRAAVGLAAADLDTQLSTIDTVVDAVKLKTDNLPSDPADASVVAGLIAGVDGKVDTVDTVVDAIKAKTDSLTFTVAGQVDANIQSVNDVTVTGTGALGDEWGP